MICQNCRRSVDAADLRVRIEDEQLVWLCVQCNEFRRDTPYIARRGRYPLALTTLFLLCVASGALAYLVG